FGKLFQDCKSAAEALSQRTRRM
ncbi:uncharacterized protein METZ01_LOCUS476010, partial [marine metagenome]